MNDAGGEPERGGVKRLRWRFLAIALGTVVALVVAEALFDLWSGPRAVVVVENQTANLIENVVIDCSTERVVVSGIEPGQNARVFLRGSRSATLLLSYEQAGRAQEGLRIPGFDLASLNDDRSELIVRIQADGVGQFTAAGEPRTIFGRLVYRARRGLEEWLEQTWFYRRLRT